MLQEVEDESKCKNARCIRKFYNAIITLGKLEIERLTDKKTGNHCDFIASIYDYYDKYFDILSTKYAEIKEDVLGYFNMSNYKTFNENEKENYVFVKAQSIRANEMSRKKLDSIKESGFTIEESRSYHLLKGYCNNGERDPTLKGIRDLINLLNSKGYTDIGIHARAYNFGIYLYYELDQNVDELADGINEYITREEIALDSLVDIITGMKHSKKLPNTTKSINIQKDKIRKEGFVAKHSQTMNLLKSQIGKDKQRLRLCEILSFITMLKTKGYLSLELTREMKLSECILVYNLEQHFNEFNKAIQKYNEDKKA